MSEEILKVPKILSADIYNACQTRDEAVKISGSADTMSHLGRVLTYLVAAVLANPTSHSVPYWQMCRNHLRLVTLSNYKSLRAGVRERRRKKVPGQLSLCSAVKPIQPTPTCLFP